MRRKKFLLAFGIACPACAGGFFLAMASIFGVSAAVAQGSILLLGLSVVAFLWGRNIWRRRGETTCTIEGNQGPL